MQNFGRPVYAVAGFSSIAVIYLMNKYGNQIASLCEDIAFDGIFTWLYECDPITSIGIVLAIGILISALIMWVNKSQLADKNQS